MVELPEDPAPNGVSPELLDYGMTLRPSTGAAVQRVNRKGSRYRLAISLPPLKPDTAAVFISRLLRAKSEGVRIPFPLVRGPQGSPGTPVVNGASPTGHTLPIRGLIPGYAIREGFWLSIEDAAGQHYLHNVSAPVMADASGLASVTITPMLRVPFLDGATIHLAKPMVEGFVDGDWGWEIPVNKLTALAFTMEEAA